MDCDTGSRKKGGVVLTSNVDRRILIFTQLFDHMNLQMVKEKNFSSLWKGVKLYLECLVHHVCGLYMCNYSCIILRSMH
jgi:hypothetical protein